MKELVDHVIKRSEQLATFRAVWENLWQDCTDYVNPRRGDFSTQQARGTRHRFDKVFDSTAPLANQNLAAGLHGHLTNATERWFSLRIPGVSTPSQSVRDYMQTVIDIMFDEGFNSSATNFTTAVHELYLDLGSYGTGVFYIEDRIGKPIQFRSFHLADCYVAENADGIVDVLYRKYKLQGRQLLELYREALPEKLIEAIIKEPLKEYSVVHATEPNDTYLPGSKKSKDMPYKSCYVLMEEKILLSEGGFNEFPYMVPRWSKTSGEVYGRSPAMMCLPDIKMVNEMMKTTIRAAQKATDPPLMVPDDGFMLPLRTIPGGLNYFRSGTSDEIKPLISGARPDIGLDFIDSRREHIRSTFHVDWLQLQEGPRMTATEVLQRQEEKMRLMGPMVGRLQTEFLGPLIERVFNIFSRRDLLPPPPADLEGVNLSIDYVSPVARAQKAQTVFNFGRLLEQMIPLANIKPEMFDNIDADATFRWAHAALDGPMETLVDEEKMQEIRQARAEQQQQMVQAEQQAQGAAAAKDAAQAAQAVGMAGGA